MTPTTCISHLQLVGVRGAKVSATRSKTKGRLRFGCPDWFASGCGLRLSRRWKLKSRDTGDLELTGHFFDNTRITVGFECFLRCKKYRLRSRSLLDKRVNGSLPKTCRTGGNLILSATHRSVCPFVCIVNRTNEFGRKFYDLLDRKLSGFRVPPKSLQKGVQELVCIFLKNGGRFIPQKTIVSVNVFEYECQATRNCGSKGSGLTHLVLLLSIPHEVRIEHCANQNREKSEVRAEACLPVSEFYKPWNKIELAYVGVEQCSYGQHWKKHAGTKDPLPHNGMPCALVEIHCCKAIA